MPVADLYSYRKRVAEGETPDVFVYDTLPEALRVQIIQIWRDAIGPFYVYSEYSMRDVKENNGVAPFPWTVWRLGFKQPVDNYFHSLAVIADRGMSDDGVGCTSLR